MGLTSTASASSEPYGHYYDEYSTVVDVTEAGADDTGDEPITPVLEDLRDDDTLLVFPEGRYYMDEQFRFTGFDNFGLVGENATLVPANYYDFAGPQYRLFRLGVSYSPGSRIRFEGFDVDQTAPETGIRTIEAYASDRLEVRDVTIHGQHDSGTWGPGMFNITDSDGTGLVDQFRAPDGGAWINNTPTAGDRWRGPIGIVANQNEGTLKFKHCWLGAFPDNGLYAADGNGKIIVQGGLYRNSNGANVRVGGRESEIRWPTVEIDSTRPEDRSQRGIRIENGRGITIHGAAVEISSPEPTSHAISVMNTCESARIENTRLDLQGDDVNHGVVISPDCGEATIVDTTITHETAGGYPFWIQNSDRTDRILAEHLTIRGQAGDASGFRDGVRCERNNCRFSNVDIAQPGRSGVERNAIVNTASDLTIYESELRASQYPYIDLGANALVRDSALESSDGQEAVCLYASSTSPTFKKNRLAAGIRDLGASDVTTWANTYE
ncbi:right-handed parallel beta-helix repeat-containing protein [Natrinema sp. 1APR25-10V2]|uniref:right-handed parallel beta-helix repeat-containing protein n=1 Tax=Natrinema sp. 1APR25-10V2 TaxID=2951081 RepID=UPI0028761BA1|nr:right-handed parallel beta-helix repeat-containing protein [Natrinema sp. 1APR25-10V2]MDS0477595.1 right-handed parallel beta-helix repeat-containing protein [Natrinema sp. 1APR25-10V2]